jgi:hypothetical protein
LLTHRIGFLHELPYGLINVGWLSQPEVVAVAERPERFNSAEAGMVCASFEPQACIQAFMPNHRPSEPDTSLKNDSGLLGINCDGSTGLGQLYEAVECLPDYLGFPLEVIGQRISSAGMPEISCDKPVAAFWASPEGFYQTLNHSYTSLQWT